jgi:hypothetical protein
MNGGGSSEPVDNFLVVVADTTHNRRVLLEFAELFSDLPRLGTAEVLHGLNRGQHPKTGYILFDARETKKPAAPATGSLPG